MESFFVKAAAGPSLPCLSSSETVRFCSEQSLISEVSDPVTHVLPREKWGFCTGATTNTSGNMCAGAQACPCVIHATHLDNAGVAPAR